MADDEDDYNFDNIPAETLLNPEEAIIRRHRREKKELQGKLVAMKKNLTKSDKKKKKELGDEMVRLEAELEQRHKLELDTFKPKRMEAVAEVVNTVTAQIPNISLNSSLAEDSDITPMNSIPGTPKLSRAQKRREKKSTEERERQKRIDQETEVLVENSEWKKEDRQLEAILKEFQLEVFDIPSDGHCLYYAVAHQMEQNGGNPIKLANLRKSTAEYLIKNKNEFMHYFDESISGSDEQFLKYCNEIESTAAWGGQVEVQILSRVLERPIRVVQANGPVLTFGEEFKTPMLTLTYHRHKIQSGEHYNSVVPTKTEG